MKLIRQFAAVLWLAVSLLAAEPPKGERVLVTAHSFHIFTAQRLAPLAKAAGIEGHELVAAQMIGGSQVIQHWKLEGERQKAKPLLTEGKVDVMTMSPHVYLPDEGINNFVELGAKQNPKMRFHVQHSWMPWDGWEGTDKITKPEDRDGRSLDIVRAANLKWRTTLEAQIKGLNQKLGRDAVFITPVGDAVIKLRELIAAGKAPGLTKHTDLFTDLIGHGKEPILALATYCNFACIYKVSPVGLKVPNAALDKLSPELDPLLRQIAWDTVTSYAFSGVKAAK